MVHKKEILTAVGTLACAVGIGFFMQHSDASEKRYGKTDSRMEAPQDKDADVGNLLLDVEAITLTSAEFENNVDLPQPDDQVMTVFAPQSNLPTPVLPESNVIPKCDISANARPVAAAMVRLTMEASCLPNERLTVHHNGMIFTATTSATGTVDLTVPALAEEAVFILAFTNGDGAVAQTRVEELGDYDRVVVQWKGQTGFQIHALEFGADYGDAGHVWSGAPRDITAGVTGVGGYITRNGNAEVPDALMAEVYTFPRRAVAQTGSIDLSVETEVSDANCGLEIEAQSLEMTDNGKIRTRNLTMDVPECDAVGSFLVLNNLLQDLKVARN